MEQPNDASMDPNPVGMLQRRHTKPLQSFKTYMQPEVQPHSSSEIKGANPWTGQTADEVREAAFSQAQFETLQHHKTTTHEQATPQGNKKMTELEELDEVMFDTAM